MKIELEKPMVLKNNPRLCKKTILKPCVYVPPINLKNGLCVSSDVNKRYVKIYLSIFKNGMILKNNT